MSRAEQPRRPSDRLAAELRSEPPTLDEIRRARMERVLLAEVRNRAAKDRGDGQPRSFRRIGRAAMFAAAAVALIVVGRFSTELGDFSTDSGGSSTGLGLTGLGHDDAVFRFETWTGIEPRSATPLELAEGDTARTRAGELLRLSFGDSTVLVEPESEVSFARLHRDLVRLRLSRGAVHVRFHPQRRGEQGFVVDTESARVEVVGTVFRVAATVEGTTHVSVQKGVVRVRETLGEGTRLLRAGERTTVLRPRPDPIRSVDAPGGPNGTSREAEAANGSPDRGANRPRFEAALGSADSHSSPEARVESRGRRVTPAHKAPERAQPSSVDALLRDADDALRAGSYEHAADLLERAARRGAGTRAGQSALFDLAMVRDKYLHDLIGAREAYHAYLSSDGDVPLAVSARRSLCRLGEALYCP